MMVELILYTDMRFDSLQRSLNYPPNSCMYNVQICEVGKKEENVMQESKLLHKLSEAEKTGIIKSDIASNHDEPTQIWKTQIALRKRAKMRTGK